VSLLLRLGLVNGLFIGYFQVGGSVQNIIENLDKGPNLFNPVHNISNRASKEEGQLPNLRKAQGLWNQRDRSPLLMPSSAGIETHRQVDLALVVVMTGELNFSAVLIT